MQALFSKNISAKDIDIYPKEAYNKGIGNERIREKPKGELIMSKYGRAADWGGSPLEELGVWAMLQPGAHHKPNVKALKQAVNDLCHLTMQKTAGQKKYAKAGDLSFDDLDGIKWTILIEAVILVLSGKLDGMEDESEDEEDGRS